MGIRRGTVVVSVCACVGMSAACNLVLGISDFTPGDGGAGSRDDGAPAQGDGGDAGEPGTCPSPADAAIGAAGCPCSQSGQLACNGNARSEPLICNGGSWMARGSSCMQGENCDSRLGPTQGTCSPIDRTCMGASPGQKVCSGSTMVVQCGPDLVSETPVSTCTNEACLNGMCVGACTPATTQCSGNGVQTCAADGGWTAAAPCPESCAAGACTLFPSCQGGGSGAGDDCGSGTSDCCSSLEVPGGMTFYRSYDAVSPGDTSKAYPATVSSFRLDAYEVTVGRFRKFVSAVVGGWLPVSGSGIHTHLNGGSGLTAVGGDAGGFETGWSASWNTNLATTQGAWATALACSASSATWTAAAGANEQLPVNCITWYEAYAFCIWDGGFLPSEAEWNYAASGGSQQRVYPWSTPATSATIDCTYANYSPSPACSSSDPNAVGSDAPKGDGAFGQSDLAGNVWEWSLDSYAGYVTTCDDCANVTSSSSRVTRGGSYEVVASALLASYRGNDPTGTRDTSIGARCARVP